MKNPFGLDDHYFSEKLGQLARDAGHYTPAEMRRALERLAEVARFDERPDPPIERAPLTSMPPIMPIA